MEESIKRAEKLVHTTNSAIAQMKYNLIFDDLDGAPGVTPKFQDRRKGKTREHKRPIKGGDLSSFEDDFKHFEHDFMSEANEMLMKMDKLLEPNRFSSARQASKARDKMKEINAKLESRRLEQLKASQTEQNRQKLLDVIAEPETTPRRKGNSSRGSETSKPSPVKGDSACRGTSPRKSEPVSGLTSRQKSKEDLKKKLLETQEIVDRGFLTARQLTQKVENMTKTDKKSERTPGSEKTFLTGVATNSRSSERVETNSELGRTPKKCVKCHRVKDVRRKGEEREKGSEKGGEDRNRIVSIKRQETRRPSRGSKLKVQHLPSLHIKGGLQVQRVHNLEILPQAEEGGSSRVNTAFKVMTHDQIEKERTEMTLREIRRENCFCGEGEVGRNSIECFNCGKLIRIREHPVVDPREIDRLLLECDFNVFDPRIDEFVEKCKQLPGTMLKSVDEEKPEIDEANVIKVKNDRPKVRENGERERRECVKKKKVIDSMKRRFKIKELSEELSRKYKKKADELEDDHLQFENILRDLFKKVDESREFFDSCKLLTTVEKEKDRSSRAVPQLSMTQPVVVSFVEEENQQQEREEKQLNDRQEVILKEKKRKLDKKDVKNKHKSRTRVQQDVLTDEEMDEEKTKVSKKTFRRKEGNKKSEEDKNPPKLPAVATQIFKEIQSSHVTQVQVTNKEVKEIWPTGVSLWRSSSSEESDLNPEDKEESVKTNASEGKTENDYDSDFEAESGAGTFDTEVILKSEEDEDYGEEDREEDQGIIRCMKKLSTISEVDSELERKLSELEPKAETPEKQETSNQSEERTESMEIPEDCKLEDDVKVAQNQRPETVDVRSASSLETVASKSGKRREEEEQQEEAARNVSPSKSSRSLKERQIKDSKEGSVSRESSSTEMVASLKEVLSALKDQFAKTQSLADKLTENVKELKTEREVEKPEIIKTHEEERKDIVFNLCLKSGDMDNSLVSNLQKLRKDLNVDVEHPKSPLSILARSHNCNLKTFEPRAGSRRRSSVEGKGGGSKSSISEGVFSDETPSLGELNLNNSRSERVVSDRKRKGAEKSDSSSVSECSLVKPSSRKKSSRVSSGRSDQRSGRDAILPVALVSNNDEISYSEGEVRSDGLLDDDASSMQSIGEVISEHISTESSLE